MHNFTQGFWDQHKGIIAQAFQQATDENVDNRLTENGSTVRFWLQHIAESKYILLHLFFGEEIPVPLVTVNGVTDTGQAGTVDQIQSLTRQADEAVERKMASFSQEELAEVRDSFLGPMTVAQIFGVFIYHSYHHLGQVHLSMKRGHTVPQPGIMAVAA